MVKKLLFVGAGAVLLSVLIFGRDAMSYLGTGVSKIHSSVKANVPIEFEIERARKMIRDLDRPIRHNMHVIAREEVQVERLARQLADAQAQLADGRRDIMRLKNDLDSGSSYFTYAGHQYSRQQVENDLENRFSRFKTQDATVAQLEKILHARQKSLDAARQKLENMLAAKRQLEVDVENLEARLKMVEVAQSTSEINFDDSHLARTKDLLTEIHTRIDVAEKLVNSSGYFQGQIPLDDEHEGSNVSEEIARYFGGDQPKNEAVAELSVEVSKK